MYRELHTSKHVLMFGSCFFLIIPTCVRAAYMEGSNEVGSVSRMFSSFQPCENNRAVVESAVPPVALQAFAFLSENTAAQVPLTRFLLSFKLLRLKLHLC